MDTYAPFDVSQPLYQLESHHTYALSKYDQQPLYPPQEADPSSSVNESGAWTYPASSSSSTLVHRATRSSTRGRSRAATLASQGQSERRRTMTDEYVSTSMSGMDLQALGDGSSLVERPQYGHSREPSLDQQVGQTWATTVTPSRPLPPQWTSQTLQGSPYPLRFPYNPRQQHHRSLSTSSNDSQWGPPSQSALSTPSSNQANSPFRNPSDFNPSPLQSPYGPRMGSSSSSVLRPSISTLSLRTVGSHAGLRSSSNGTVESAYFHDEGQQWASALPRSTVSGGYQSFQSPALSPSASSNHSFSNLPHTPAAPLSSAYSAYRVVQASIATSPSGQSTYSNSTTSSSSFQVPRSRSRPTQISTSRQTYAATAPAQKHPRNAHARARSSPSPSLFPSPSRTPATKGPPEIASGDSAKRSEAIAAIAFIQARGLSPFAEDSSYPFITGPKGAEKLKMKLTVEQKFELCRLKELFPTSKQNDIASKYGIERSTVSKIWKERARWLATDKEQYDRSQHTESSGDPAVVKPTRFTELEDPLLRWVRFQIDATSVIPCDKAIKEKALEIAKILRWKEERFKASTGWLENFRLRHSLRPLRSPGGGINVSPAPGDVVDGDEGSYCGEYEITEESQPDWSELERDLGVNEGEVFRDEDAAGSSIGAAVGEVERGWKRSHSAQSSSSSSSLGGLRNSGNLAVVVEHQVQHPPAQTQSRRALSRISSSSSYGLTTSIINSPASSMDGLRTPDLALEPDATVTPTNPLRALRSAARSQQPFVSSSVTPSDNSYHHHRVYPYPDTISTSFNVRDQQNLPSTSTSGRSVSDPVVLHRQESYGSSPHGSPLPYQTHRPQQQASFGSQATSYAPEQHTSSSTGYEGTYPCDLVPNVAGWNQPGDYEGLGSEDYVFGESEEHASSAMVPGEFGLYPSVPSTDQRHYNQPQGQHIPHPTIPHLLPGYSTYHDESTVSLVSPGLVDAYSSLGSRSACSSSSTSSYALSPKPSGHDWLDNSPTIYGGSGSPSGVGYVSPIVNSKEADQSLLPGFQPVRTRAYTTSSLSMAFPVQQQQSAPRVKTISQEEGRHAYDTALRFFAQSDEPDNLERALSLTLTGAASPFVLDDGESEFEGR